MPSPSSRDKSARKARAVTLRERAETSRWSQAREVACRQVGLGYKQVPAPANEADVRFLTTLPPDMDYNQRARYDRMRKSAEILTESVRG